MGWEARRGSGPEARVRTATRRIGRPEPTGGGRRRDPGAGRQARPRRRLLREGRRRRPCVRAESEAAPSPRGPRRRCQRRGRRGGSPEGPRRPAQRPGTQGCDRGKAPPGKGEPVEDPLGDDRPGRRRAETPHPKHRLGAGQSLEPGRPVGIDGPADQPADEAAGGVGNDDHAGEPLRAPLHEQPAVPEPVGGEAVRLKGLSQPATWCIAEAQAGCRGRAD